MSQGHLTHTAVQSFSKNPHQIASNTQKSQLKEQKKPIKVQHLATNLVPKTHIWTLNQSKLSLKYTKSRA